MNSSMNHKIIFLGNIFATFTTFVRYFSCIKSLMTSKSDFINKESHISTVYWVHDRATGNMGARINHS